MASSHPSKKRRLSPPAEEAQAFGHRRGKAQWDLEQDYERQPRQSSKRDKERTRLPIKTSEGLLQNVEESEASVESDSFLGTDSDEDEDEDGDENEDENENEEDGVQNGRLEDETAHIPVKVQIVQAKEQLARMATLINEDPEAHLSSLKTMAEMVENAAHVTIKKLALASQAAIYKDLIPGYRIRPLGEEDMSAKVSKEVRKLRTFEQTLLSGYRDYVQRLASLAKAAPPQPEDTTSAGDRDGLRSVAINCASSLLLAVPHFNFRLELLKILVNRLARHRAEDADFTKCRQTVEELFSRDDDGIVSLEAVRLICKMMKARDYRVHESVLDSFLHLRLLSEFSSKGSRDRIDRRTADDAAEELMDSGKKRKQKREFRTKRERKLAKERQAVERDMKEADALVSHEERDKNQAETLKLVFGAYFRILKLRSPTLTGPVLEGLAKYAHLINQDFFADLLEALKELIAHAEITTTQSDANGLDRVDDDDDNDDKDRGEVDNTPSATAASSLRNTSSREALLCTVTAFALLEGQDASKAATTLHLDLSFFVKHLYRSLYSLSANPDIEFNPSKSLRLADPLSGSKKTRNEQEEHGQEHSAVGKDNNNKVNFQTLTVLLLRCLQSALLSRAHGITPPMRVAAFSKRLMTASLQLPEKSSLATLSFLDQVAKHHGRRIAPLWHSEERRGDGVFNPFAADVESTNVFAATVWEGELLRVHYCPQVRAVAADIEKSIASL